VARQVGTDSKFGAQATVPDVASDQVRGIVTAFANGGLNQRLTMQAKGEVTALADKTHWARRVAVECHLTVLMTAPRAHAISGLFGPRGTYVYGLYGDPGTVAVVKGISRARQRASA
jgi:hypothetical protein